MLLAKWGLFPKIWEEHTSDWEIIKTVQGDGINFLELPFQERKPNLTRGQDLDLLRKEVEKLRQQGVVEFAEQEEGQFLKNPPRTRNFSFPVYICRRFWKSLMLQCPIGYWFDVYRPEISFYYWMV